MGVPPKYGSGAEQVVAAVHKNPLSKHEWVTDLLGTGDIDRIIIEWRSMLRQIAHAPEMEWSRWQELKRRAREMLQETESPTLTTLPPLEYHQTEASGSSSGLATTLNRNEQFEWEPSTLDNRNKEVCPMRLAVARGKGDCHSYSEFHLNRIRSLFISELEAKGNLTITFMKNVSLLGIIAFGLISPARAATNFWANPGKASGLSPRTGLAALSHRAPRKLTSTMEEPPSLMRP